MFINGLFGQPVFSISKEYHCFKDGMITRTYFCSTVTIKVSKNTADFQNQNEQCYQK